MLLPFFMGVAILIQVIKTKNNARDLGLVHVSKKYGNKIVNKVSKKDCNNSSVMLPLTTTIESG